MSAGLFGLLDDVESHTQALERNLCPGIGHWPNVYLRFVN